MGEYFGTWQPQSIGNCVSKAPVRSVRSGDAVMTWGHNPGPLRQLRPTLWLRGANGP